MFNLVQIEGFSYRSNGGHLSMFSFYEDNPEEVIEDLINRGCKEISRLTMWEAQYKKSGNRLDIDLDYADFEAKADYISTGNVISNVMHGNFIRARNKLECNGRVNLPGYLQDYDLKTFRQYKIDEEIKKDQWFEENNGWAYALRHQNPKGNLIVHGVIVTDLDHKPIMVFDYTKHAKSRRVLELGMLLLTDKRIVSSTPAQNSIN
jgi:hypothetical protein